MLLGLLLSAVCVLLAAGYYMRQMRDAQAVGSAAQQASFSNSWQTLMKDEDRSQLMATPVPYQLEPMSGSSFHKIYRGDATKRQVALTFDDGPHPDSTPALLAMLKQYHVKATFFVVGMRAEQYPELIKAEAADGHCIANHTYHHDKLTDLGPVNLAMEIRACSDVIKKITGKAPVFFRPPGGSFDAQVTDAAQRQGLTTVLWTVNPGDFHRPGIATVEARALHDIGNGTIILFHDGVADTVAALPSIITKLRAQGYEFVTIEEMVGHTQ
jgi:peptidoglycan/xylan/chitin deacetylase (PgdA/CDA1 family)